MLIESTPAISDFFTAGGALSIALAIAKVGTKYGTLLVQLVTRMDMHVEMGSKTIERVNEKLDRIERYIVRSQTVPVDHAQYPHFVDKG